MFDVKYITASILPEKKLYPLKFLTECLRLKVHFLFGKLNEIKSNKKDEHAFAGKLVADLKFGEGVPVE